MDLFEELQKIHESEELFEMANIHPDESGIQSMLYATFDGAHEPHIPHWARVKVRTKNKGLFPILLDPIVQPLNKNGEYDSLKAEDKELVDEAIEYIKKYRNVFLDHWNGKLKDYELHDILLGRTK